MASSSPDCGIWLVPTTASPSPTRGSETNQTEERDGKYGTSWVRIRMRNADCDMACKRQLLVDRRPPRRESYVTARCLLLEAKDQAVTGGLRIEMGHTVEQQPAGLARVWQASGPFDKGHPCLTGEVTRQVRGVGG